MKARWNILGKMDRQCDDMSLLWNHPCSTFARATAALFLCWTTYFLEDLPFVAFISSRAFDSCLSWSSPTRWRNRQMRWSLENKEHGEVSKDFTVQWRFARPGYFLVICLATFWKNFLTNLMNTWAGVGARLNDMFCMKVAMMSTGTGKTMVLLFSAEMLFKVCS